MKKIILLLIVVFALLACSDNDDKTYRIKILNNTDSEISDIIISMDSLDETDPKTIDTLAVGEESINYKFNFDRSNSNGCKTTGISLLASFEVSYILNGLTKNTGVGMDNRDSKSVLLIIEEDSYQVIDQ